MTLLDLKLTPSGVANRYVLFQVLRSGALVALIGASFLFPVVWGLVFFALYVALTFAYYLYAHRLVLCIFSLAQKAEREGQPVGRPSVPPVPADDSDLRFL